MSLLSPEHFPIIADIPSHTSSKLTFFPLNVASAIQPVKEGLIAALASTFGGTEPKYRLTDEPKWVSLRIKGDLRIIRKSFNLLVK